jgi:hypothetical protein
MEKWEALFDFHFSMPLRCLGQPSGRRWRIVTQRRVRSDSIVVDAPVFGQRARFLHRVEDLSIQKLFAQF